MPRTYILLIEEQAEFLNNVEFLVKLRPQLALIATVTNGTAGLRTAQVLQPDITLIDLQLDGFTSLETIRNLRTSLPGMGIIAISYNDQSVYRQAALAAGADEFVAKTCLIEDLLTVIQQVAQVRQVKS
jgi:two-component system nitrate/nitrite response regulator NarL